MTYIMYKGNEYKLKKGPNGGKYINVNGKKIYMDKKQIRKNIIKKTIKKSNSRDIKDNSINTINNLEVVIMNNTKIVRKILKKIEIKDGKCILPENHFSKDYYERITGFKWECLDWE
jgi:hypothetical protein